VSLRPGLLRGKGKMLPGASIPRGSTYIPLQKRKLTGKEESERLIIPGSPGRDLSGFKTKIEHCHIARGCPDQFKANPR